MFRFEQRASLICFILILYETQTNGDIVHVSRRQDDSNYRMCAPNFEIHQDKIIRTEESKRMGANYLNGKDVSSKDECVKFCCETANCNVFVLEEKVFNQQPGTCYLFECGTPDNFKCKFTRHHNYSSAVLIINRPQIQLEDEIQYTQHERELTNLRVGDLNNTKTKNCHHTTKASTLLDEEAVRLKNAKQLAKPKDSAMNTNNFRKTSRCSRYQFECRTSGECIAIYNACDGIPQCADHSDEDSELGCPTNAPATVFKRLEGTHSNENYSNGGGNLMAEKAQISVEPSIVQYPKDAKLIREQPTISERIKNPLADDQNVIINRQSLSRQYNMNQWQSKLNAPQSAYNGVNNVNRNEIPSENYQPNTNVADPRLLIPHEGQQMPSFGREGEPLDGNEWQAKNVAENRVFKQSYGPLHNFNHKQNELNIPYNYGEYVNTGMNSPYKNGNGNGNGNGSGSGSGSNSGNSNGNGNGNTYSDNNNYYQSNLNSWHQKIPSNYGELEERRFPDRKNVPMSKNPIPPEYFYEEINGPVAKINEHVLAGSISAKTSSNVAVKAATNEKKPTTTLKSPTQKISLQSTTGSVQDSQYLTTTKINKNGNENVPVDEVDEKVSNEPNSHRKLEKQLVAEVSDVQERLLDSSIVADGYTEQPSGAFISLTLGLCVTAIMVFVVGCRLKVVRKRVRRGGKAPYAHDADFLVNGMYL